MTCKRARTTLQAATASVHRPTLAGSNNEEVRRNIPDRGSIRHAIIYGPHECPVHASAISASAADIRRYGEKVPLGSGIPRYFRLCSTWAKATVSVRTISNVITEIFINVSFLTYTRTDKNTQKALTECSARAFFRHIFLFLKSFELF